MKKVLFYISLLTLGSLVACDPLDDTYQELDAQVTDDTEINVMLTDDAYEVLEDVDTVPEYIYKNHYFTSPEEAEKYLPSILNAEFPHLGDGAFGKVSFNLLQLAFKNTGVANTMYYEVTEADYDALGQSYKNFDDEEQLFDFLDYKYPSVEDSTHLILTYQFYNGSRIPTTQTQVTAFYYNDGVWYDGFRVTDEYYAYFERNRFNNFTGVDDDNLEAYFSFILKNEFPTAKDGDVEFVSYAYYNGSSTVQEIAGLQFDGANWSMLEDGKNVLTVKTLPFKKELGTWIPDIARYELQAGDYTAISENVALGTESARSNLADYGNFATSRWSDEEILAAINFILKKNFPEYEEGQEVLVTYNTYPGGDQELSLILTEGVYVEVE